MKHTLSLPSTVLLEQIKPAASLAANKCSTLLLLVEFLEFAYLIGQGKKLLSTGSIGSEF
jgi:hypothetical protein